MIFHIVLIVNLFWTSWGQLEPQIVKISEDQVNNLGEVVALKCVTRDAGDFPVVWNKLGKKPTDTLFISSGGSTILPDSRFSVEVSSDKSTYRLKIRDASGSDSGTYQCAIVASATNIYSKNVDVAVIDFGSKIPSNPMPHIAQINDDQKFNAAPIVQPDTVFEQVIDLNPQITEITQDVTVSDGETIDLQCFTKNAKDFPIYWKKYEATNAAILTSGDNVVADNDRVYVRINENKTLYELRIVDARPSDAGTYQCEIAASGTRTFSKNVDVDVVNIQYAGPTISQITPNQEIFEEDSVNLQCRTKNAQKYPVLWMKTTPDAATILTAGDIIVSQDYRISFYISRKSAIYTLNIAGATIDDTATYHCMIITPGFNVISKSVDLKVYSKLTTPAVTDISLDRDIDLGETLEMFCSVKNAENIAVYWKKLDDHGKEKAVISFGNKVIVSDKRISLYVNHDHSLYKLKITNVTASDGGIYQCQIDPSTYNTYPFIVGVTVNDPTSGRSIAPATPRKKLYCISGYATDFPAVWKKLTPFIEEAKNLESGTSIRVDDKFSVQVIKDDDSVYYKLTMTGIYENDSKSYNCLIILPNPPAAKDTKQERR